MIRSFNLLYLLARYRCFWIIKFINGYKPSISQSVRLTKFLEAAGPSTIKLGQALSTREDVFGKNMVVALAKLQDNIKAFPFKHVLDTIEKEIGNPSLYFKHIDETPIASASIAQVHKATLINNQQVVIKIVRPNIAKKINKDIALIRKISTVINFVYADAKRLHLIESIDELERNIKNEQNLTFEASSMDEIRENILKDGIENIVIPKVYWSLTSVSLLTIEWVDAVSIRDLDFLNKHSIDKKYIVNQLLTFFYASVINHGFFHADWHAGNILINKNSKIIFVDFGLVGRISYNNRFHLANVIHGFLIKDYIKTAQSHINAGWVSPNTSVEEFAGVCRSIMSPIFDKYQQDISLPNLILQLFQITKRFGMHTQPQLLLLQKNMLQLEGIGRNLLPQENMWELATPIINNIVNKNVNKQEYTRYLVKKSRNLIWKIPAYLASFDKYKSKLDELVENPRRTNRFTKTLFYIVCALIVGLVIGVLIK